MLEIVGVSHAQWIVKKIIPHNHPACQQGCICRHGIIHIKIAKCRHAGQCSAAAYSIALVITAEIMIIPIYFFVYLLNTNGGIT